MAYRELDKLTERERDALISLIGRTRLADVDIDEVGALHDVLVRLREWRDLDDLDGEQ